MTRTFKKTAIIGLGGTGMHAVLHMKRRLIETYGKVPPMIKFLVIDTTDKEELITADGSTELEPGEFLRLEVKDPASLITTNREVREWFPKRVPLFSLTSGAKQVRPLGRLAAFANAAPLEAALEGLLNSLKDWRVDRNSEYEVQSEAVVVNLVCSLAGGTGSGCFFDVAVLTRSRLSSTDKLIGYFLLPDIFLGKAAVDNIEPNAYAAIKELSYLFDQPKLRYSLGGRVRNVPQGLFNAAYLVNKTNRHGVQYNNERDLQEFLAVGMIMQSTATGKGAQDVVDNLEAQLIGKRWYGKPTVFSSFGVSELVYPGIWYADLHATKLALRTIQTVFQGGDLREMDQFTDDFVRRAGIREHQADDVIDALADPSLTPRFPQPKALKKSIIAQVLSRKTEFLVEAERRIHDQVLESLERLKGDKASFLNAEIDLLLERPQGLAFAKTFLAALSGRLTEFRREMVEERDALEQDRDAVQSRYPSAEEQLRQAGDSFFGVKGKIDATLRNYKALVDQDASLLVQLERRERAVDFFAFMLHEAERARDEIESIVSYCEALTKEFHEYIERLHSGRREKRPFLEELTPDSLSSIEVNTSPDDFLKWLKETDRGTIRGLKALRIEGLKQLLLEYAHLNPTVSKIRDQSIEDILRAMPEDERKNYIQKLDMMAAPLWQYDQGLVSGEKRTENIYVFGVEDAGRTVFSADDIRKAVASPWEPTVLSTGDPQRIVCFKIEAAVPAFVVSHMPRYRERYMDPDRPFAYHLHKDWESILPDLFPAAEEEEARRYWSLALAKPFGLIIKRGPYYYIRSEKRGDRTKDYLARLAQGRREAMQAFVQDHELVEETKAMIERINEELGNAIVVENLKEYGEKLERQASRQGEKIRKQIELELMDIEQYMVSVSSL